MRSLGGAFLFILAIIWGHAAFADHMTGRYQGTGDIGGVVLDLRQSGTALQGTISGSDQGTLEGQTDGGNNATGVIRLAAPGNAPIQFQAIWSQQGLAMRLQFATGTRDVTFVPAGGGPGPGPNPPGPGPTPPGPGPGPTPPGPPPLPGPTDVQYFTAENGQPVGPLTLDQMIQRIVQGQTGPEDLVWKTGAPAWARADSYPELAQAFAPPQPGPPPLPPGPDGPNPPPPPPPPPDPGPPPGPGGDGKTPPSGGDPGGGGGGGGGDPNAPQAPPSNPGGGGSGGGGAGGGGAGGGGLTPPSQ